MPIISAVQTPTSLTSISAVDSYFIINTKLSSIVTNQQYKYLYFINTNIRSRYSYFIINIKISTRQPLHQYTSTHSYFINTTTSSRQLLHQRNYQQQIVTSSTPLSAVDSNFIDTNIDSYYMNITSSIQISAVAIPTSSTPISEVDRLSYFITNTKIRSRQLLHQHKYLQQMATSSTPISALDSYFIQFRTAISSRQILHQHNVSNRWLLHQHCNQQQIVTLSTAISTVDIFT